MGNHYKNSKEAKEAIANLEDQLTKILDEELHMIHEDHRTVGQWLNLFGRDKDKEETRKKLLDLETEIVDATLYLRHLVTSYDFEIGTNLNETFN